MSKIAYITCGRDQQIISYCDVAYYLDDLIYLPYIKSKDLSKYDVLILPDAMYYEDIAPFADVFNEYLEKGGFLVVFACLDPQKWLRSVKLKWLDYTDNSTQSWWKTPQERGIYQPEPKHSLCETASLDDMCWHWHGIYALDKRAKSALNLGNDVGSMFLDFENLPNGGRLIATTLDPHHHNGKRFMPSTASFLSKFYPWLNKEVGRFPHNPEGERFKVTYMVHAKYVFDIYNDRADMKNMFNDTDIDISFQHSQISPYTFEQSDLIYIDSYYDQVFFRDKQQWFLDYLKRGGQIVLSSEIAIPWLPFLSHFQAVPPKPFTNLKTRIRQDPFGFFKNMSECFVEEKIYGFYARGWSDMPKNAIWITEVGSEDNPKPADWLWQYPSDNGKGGKIFVHNGYDLCLFPDHGQYKYKLLKDVIQGMLHNRHKPINPYTRHPHPPFHNISNI